MTTTDQDNIQRIAARLALEWYPQGATPEYEEGLNQNRTLLQNKFEKALLEYAAPLREELERKDELYFDTLADHKMLATERDTLTLRVKELERVSDSPTWPHVLKFALRMEAKLEKNRHKGDREGWLKDHPWNLVERVLDETVELQQCFAVSGTGRFVPPVVSLVKTAEETADECADIANFCMMVADSVTVKSRAEKQAEGEKA